MDQAELQIALYCILKNGNLKFTSSKKCKDNQAHCVIEIDFHHRIDFKYLTIVKRQRFENGVNRDNEKYRNVCLTLDDDDELCTPNGYGFDIKSNSSPYEIDFILPKTRTKNVKLSFRETEPAAGQGANYHALIADLKIRYSNVYDTGE